MKKFFTLICAIAIAFSASAAQIAPKAELAKKAVAVEQMQKVQLEKAQVANFNQLSATSALKVFNQEAKASAVKPAARKLATAEPIVVIIDGTPSIQPAGNVQAITVIGKDNMVYAWGVKTTSLEAGKTYAFTDMSTDYTYRCSQDYFSTFEDPTDATFSIDAENNITASIVTESGTYMVYTKAPQPEPVEITLVSDTLNFFTKMLSAGYYQMQGYTVDSTYAFSFYFISKSLSGFFTEEDMDAYSTWVDQKDGKKTVVSYQNLSAANVTVSLVKDTLYYTGTMTLATNDGQEANITLNLSCPFTQTWGEWEDFAPFGLNTGKYSFSALGVPYTQRNIAVQFRKDNTGLKQYKLAKWGDGMFAAPGEGKVDLTITVNGQNSCTITPTITDMSSYAITDYTTGIGATDKPSTYDPETGTFNLAAVYFNPSSFEIKGIGYETFVMDKPITERDTVDVVSTKMTFHEFLAANQAVQFYAGSDAEGYTTFLVTSKNASTIDGTFELYGGGTCYADSTDGSKIFFTDGQITIVKEDDVYHLTGWVIGDNEKYYRLDWKEMAGVLEYDSDAPFDATFAWSDMDASISNGVIGIYATNAENYTIGLELYADPAATEIPEGVYTISDSQEAGTALKSIGIEGGYLTECWAGTRAASGGINVPCWFIVEGTVTLNYDEYGKLKVVVDGKNSYGQPVTALVQYVKLEPKSEVTIEADNLTFNGAGTAFMLDAANADYEVVLAVMSMDTAGTYGVEDLVAAYSAIYSAAGQVSILDGEFTLAVDGKNMTLTGSLLASDTIQYNLNFTGYMGALSYDQDEDVTMSFNLEDATMSGRGGVTTISIQNANQEVVALQVVAQLDGEKLPEGEYLINDTKESNTVIASTGVDPTTSMVSPSYVGLFEGTSLGKVWFLRSGKMTVDAKGNMTINAKNSLDRDVVVTIVVSPTDLININAAVKATKVVRNGRMMVIKDAKVYSVLGQQIQ